MPIDINERIDATRRNSRRRLNLDELTVVLGRNDTNAVANTRMPGRVWVSIYASNGLLGFRSALAPTKYFTLEPNTPVKLKYDVRGRLQVDEPDADAQLTTGVDPVARATLQTDNSTPQSNFETLRVIQSDTADLWVWVKAWKIYGSGSLTAFEGAGVNMTSYVPSSGNMLYAMIALQSDYATIEVVTSTARSIGDIDLNVDDENECIALLTAGSTPIWAIKLIGGQTAITQSDIDLDGQDERQLVNNIPSSGGTGTVTNVSWVTNDGVSAAIANPTTTPTITPSLGAITPDSTKAKGTGGAGFFEDVAQSANPSAPAATGWRAFATSVGHLAWRIKNGSDTFVRSFIGVLTADRAYTWPDYDGTVATTAGVETLTNKTMAAATNHIDGGAIDSGTVPAARLGVMTGDSGSGGAKGAVPAPATGDATKVLSGAGTWISLFYQTIKKAGSALTQRPVLNFIDGSNVSITVADNSGTGATDITIASAGSGGGGSTISVTTASREMSTLLYDSTLGSAGQFDVSSISGSYDRLELILTLRSNNASTSTNGTRITLNNDTTNANYNYFNVFNGNPSGTVGASGADRYIGESVGGGATAGKFSTLLITIPNYVSTTYQKNVTCEVVAPQGTSTSGYRQIYGVRWANTAAINRIGFLTDDGASSNNFATGSRLQIFGIKTETVVTNVSGTGTTLFTATATATVANTTAETSLLGTGTGSKTLPANNLALGSTLRIKASGYFTDTGTPTLRLKVKLGSTVILDTTAIALAGTISNNYWEVTAEITCRTTGASGTVIGQGKFEYDTSTHGATIEGLVNTSTTTIDTTVTQAIDVTATWGTASASNTISGAIATIEQLN